MCCVASWLSSPTRKRLGVHVRRSGFSSRVLPDVSFDLTRLLVFSRWSGIDAGVNRFFPARLPEDVRVAGFGWRRLERILTLWRDQGLSLDFSTFSSLRSLSDFSSCAVLLSEYGSG